MWQLWAGLLLLASDAYLIIYVLVERGKRT